MIIILFPKQQDNMTMKIGILTPTRGRPGEALNMLQSAIVRAVDKDNIRLWFWIDEDDETINDYATNFEDGPYSEWIGKIIGPRTPLGKCWNKMAKADKSIDIYMMGNDDWIMATHGWDEIIRKEAKKYPDGIYVFYPHDMNDGKCTFPIVSSKWLETLGYLYPEIFEFLAHDTYAAQVGEKIGRLIKLPFTVDHKHFAFGKAKYDKTYSHWRETGATKRDVELLAKSQDLIETDAEKLKKVMK